jgi:membrane-associated protease RseP (regulator of RpoE activity)
MASGLALVFALVGMVAMMAAMIVAGAIGRWVVVRALGVRGVPFPFGAGARWSWTTRSVVPQALGTAGSIAAAYATSGVLMAVGTWSAGAESYDRASMRVDVVRGGPADQGGVRGGDRVDAVDGERVTSWDALRSAVGRHPSEPVDLALSRDGAAVHVTVTPDRQGRILVTVPVEHRAAGFGQCVRAGVLGPAEVLYATAKGFVAIAAGTQRAEPAGPVGIVREAAGHGGAGGGILYLGALGACLVPLLAIPTVFTGPGRRRKRGRWH